MYLKEVNISQREENSCLVVWELLACSMGNQIHLKKMEYISIAILSGNFYHVTMQLCVQ